jgi:hypothetical protein
MVVRCRHIMARILVLNTPLPRQQPHKNLGTTRMKIYRTDTTLYAHTQQTHIIIEPHTELLVAYKKTCDTYGTNIIIHIPRLTIRIELDHPRFRKQQSSFRQWIVSRDGVMCSSGPRIKC